jgi:hypothetical protein
LACDEVSTIDYQRSVFLYVYVVQNWLLIPILLSLEDVVARFSVDNLTQVLIQVLMNQGGLFK